MINKQQYSANKIGNRWTERKEEQNKIKTKKFFLLRVQACDFLCEIFGPGESTAVSIKLREKDRGTVGPDEAEKNK